MQRDVMATNATGYFMQMLRGEQSRVIVEGTYGGDLLDSRWKSYTVPAIPSGMKSLVIDGRWFDLVGVYNPQKSAWMPNESIERARMA